jgi:NAD(P)-dependent dehydrogenase (short-subunit alcohol dehydrogenase family)
MDFGITGKLAFVSGGSKGVGRQVSEMLAHEGCQVFVVARGQAAIDDTVAAIKNAGGMAVGFAADLTRKDGILQALEACRQSFGGMPDIVITNVQGPAPGKLMDLDPEDFVNTFHDLTISTICIAQAVIPHMSNKGWGRFVSINAGSAKEPLQELKNLLNSSIRSSGVSLNKALSNEFGPNGITVNSVGTGYIGSECMYDHFEKAAAKRGISKDQLIEETTRQIPARRLGTPAEEAALVVFLCSELGGYVTGAYIPVDGGLHRSAW